MGLRLRAVNVIIIITSPVHPSIIGVSCSQAGNVSTSFSMGNVWLVGTIISNNPGEWGHQVFLGTSAGSVSKAIITM